MRRYSEVIPLVLVGVAAIAFVTLAILPARRRLGTAQAETARLQSEITAEGARLAALDSIHREVVMLRRRTGEFDRRVPIGPGLGEFLNDLAAVVERSGLQNHIFQPRPSHPAEPERLPRNIDPATVGVHVQPIMVQCEGHFDALFHALAAIENFARLTEFDNIKIASDPRRPGWLKIEMQMNIFFRPAAQPDTGGR